MIYCITTGEKTGMNVWAGEFIRDFYVYGENHDNVLSEQNTLQVSMDYDKENDITHVMEYKIFQMRLRCALCTHFGKKLTEHVGECNCLAVFSAYTGEIVPVYVRKSYFCEKYDPKKLGR